MALSEKLYELRKKRALSQEQLAEQLGVSRQANQSGSLGKQFRKPILLFQSVSILMFHWTI